MSDLPTIVVLFKYGFSFVLMLTGVIILYISFKERVTLKNLLSSWPAWMGISLVITAVIFLFATHRGNILFIMKTVSTVFTILYALYATKYQLFRVDEATGKRQFTKMGYVGIVFIIIISASSVSADFLKTEIDRQIQKIEYEQNRQQKQKMERSIFKVLQDVDLTKDQATSLREQLKEYIDSVAKEIAEYKVRYDELREKYARDEEQISAQNQSLEMFKADKEKSKSEYDSERSKGDAFQAKFFEEKSRCETLSVQISGEREKCEFLKGELEEEKNRVKQARGDLEKAQGALISQKENLDTAVKGLNAAAGTIGKSIREPADKMQEMHQGFADLLASYKGFGRNAQDAIDSAVQKLQALHSELAPLVNAAKQKDAEKTQ